MVTMTTEIDKEKAILLTVPRKMASTEKDKDKDREKDKDKIVSIAISSNSNAANATAAAGGSSGSAVPSGSRPSQQSHSGQVVMNQDAPNILVYKKMESIVERMQSEEGGVSVRTIKAFMSKVPSVFTGADLIAWIMKNLAIEDVAEALHLAHLLASHGYLFPIDDHQLTVKNDGTFYRFQTPYFWPSNCWEPENTDYAVYLCKRTMQNES